MKLRETYTISFLAKLPDGFDKQLKLVLEGKTFQLTEWNESEKRAMAIIETPVNRKTRT